MVQLYLIEMDRLNAFLMTDYIGLLEHLFTPKMIANVLVYSSFVYYLHFYQNIEIALQYVS